MKKFYTVIHSESLEQTLDNVELSIRANADGCFLINHSITTMQLYYIYTQVNLRFPEFWTGLNYLGVYNMASLEDLIPMGVSGMWYDNLYVDETFTFQMMSAHIHQESKRKRAEVFGGVDFKYQKGATDLSKASKIATRYCDVVTTSGPATGEAPNVQKLVTMKEAIGTHRLGLASGVNAGNVKDFLPYVDDFLVATGVSRSFIYLDEDKVKELADLIHS